MKEINQVLKLDHSVLFIAPPAWGKTRMLIELIKNSDDQWIFVSPLRALANEFFEAISLHVENTFLIKSKKEFDEVGNFKLMVLTPEVCRFEKLLANKNLKIVFDEFHLIYHWGDTFRFQLIEFYHFCLAYEFRLLLLTATMDEIYLERAQDEIENLIIINLGNQKLKNLPSKYYLYRKNDKNFIMDNMIYSALTNHKVHLVFCQFRDEVWQMQKYLKKLGILALGCVGGKASEFQALLETCPKVRVIVATTALSHGVNLPQIGQIYFTYPIDNKDFWVQMAGRGGRRGEKFEIHTMDFHEEYGKKIKSRLNAIFLWIRVKIKMELDWY